MIIDNTDALRNWLTSYLEPLCDADPHALAKYVMALIKKDKTEKDLKNVCLDQLEVFLQNNTISFVDTLFETITNKTYIKSSSNISSSTTTTPTTAVITTATTTTTTTITTNTSSAKSSPQTSQQFPTQQSDVSSQQKSQDLGSNATNKTSDQMLNSQNTESSLVSISRSRDRRNRSRSRSRSPSFRSTHRIDFDRRQNPRTRNGNSYERNEERRRHIQPANLQRRGAPQRSRSYSRDKELPPNKRIRTSSRPNSRSPSPQKSSQKDEENKKCRDYEEKGFCLKGHLCPYDHGNDPVVLDSNVSAALGITNNTPTNTPYMALPPSGPYNLAEPYNPEAPGMDIQRQHPPPGPGGPPPLLGPRMPPPPPHGYWPPPPMPIRGPMPGGPPLPPPQFMAPPGRPRELIGVPTIDNSIRPNQTQSNRTVVEPNVSQMSIRGGMRGGFTKHGRGGYRNVRRVANESSDKSCLEVRKIPSNLNSISHLNQHFSKFGTIVNLQVCHEGDPEAALVQYATNSQAFAAIRSTEAVLNNRFIKVFWHSKDQQQTHEHMYGAKPDNTDESDNKDTLGTKVSIKDRLGHKVNESTENVLTAINSSGTISRTVFDPSKLKKNNTIVHKEANSKSNNEETALSNATLTQINAKKALKLKSTNTQKQQIFSKQHKILQELITNQKQLMTKLEKSANETERNTIKQTIDQISDKIQVISDYIKKLMNDSKNLKKEQTREELMTEILNTDLDMFIKMQNNDGSYVDLANRYAKLKKKEKILVSNRGRHFSPYPMRGRGYPRSRGRFRRGGNPHLKVDRRTRKLLIPDINKDDMTDLLEHLAQFSDVETIEPSTNGAVVTFKTRVDAENAVQNISQIKFKENFQLNYSWFDDKSPKIDGNSLLNKTNSQSKSENETIDREIEGIGEELLDFEEDETEEDESEARNWKA
ncbi:RNA-binding protein 26-like isoform X2 [Oppia nitens]|uniref:RNA-binding protein 26-like isoform X2 n=1 Tax=Oppia nitens TaxID=1686743 RepID=UPI0023DB364C|nr:RNA-binding protein 26-like isoform X2 [Oppia nitens]